MKKIVISYPLRTAIGTFGGTLKEITAVELGAVVLREIIQRSKINPALVNDCIIGSVLQAGQGMNPARQVALKGGLPVTSTAQTINRVCASGLQAVVLASQSIQTGENELLVAGGIENMDQAPYLLKKARYGYRMSFPRDEILDGMVSDGLWDVFGDYHMGFTVELLVEKYGISREEQDRFAYNSQMKALKAIDEGRFEKQIVSVPLPSKKEPLFFSIDEHPRRDVSLEKLAALRPVFKKDGTITAGNASGINDGAALMLVSSEEVAKELNLAPMGYLKSYAVAGVEPDFMGIGPVPAIKKALEKAKLSLDDIDLFELNEAFAGQALSVLREIPIPEEKLNVNGGAIGLGHPIGASGAILTVKLLHEMDRRKVNLGLVSLCAGGGMGIAAIFERTK